MFPPPHRRVERIGEDLTSRREENPSRPIFLLQGQGWLSALSIKKISFSSPLASSLRWGQRGKNWPFRQCHSAKAWVTQGGPSLSPYAHFSCSLCRASWMLGLLGANWEMGDLHVTPDPLHTSPRLELEATGRICQPTGHSANQLELAHPHQPFQLPHEDQASFACVIILPACAFFANEGRIYCTSSLGMLKPAYFPLQLSEIL